ncbi:MAG: uroporphyrinogen-III synthase [Sneathiella sp.]
MKLLITRPEETADKLADKLIHVGHEVLISPLIQIEYRDEYSLDNPVSLDGVQAFVVTSANGVRGLLKVTQNRTLPLFAVGDKSATIARQAGFENVFSAGGDVSALAALIIRQGSATAGTYLHVGGARLAGDLEILLTQAGFKYRREILYDAKDAAHLDEVAKSALEDGSLDGILLFSPHTATVFKSVVERTGLKPHLQGVTAWCLSKNTATVIVELPFGNCFVAAKPTETSLLEEIAMNAIEMADKGQDNSDKAREQIVSETPKNENADQTDKKKTSANTFSSSESINKPLPDSLTGNGQVASGKGLPPKKSNAGKISLALFIVFCLGLAAWPIIYPKVSPYLPEQTRQIIQGYFGNPASDKVLEQRLAALEGKSPVDLGSLQSELQKSQTEIASLRGDVATFMENSDVKVTQLQVRMQGQETENQSTKSSLEALKKFAVQAPSTTNRVVASADTAPEILSSINLLNSAVEDLRKELKDARQDLSASQTEAAASNDQIAALSSALTVQIEKSAGKGGNEEEALTLLALGQLQRESRDNQPFDGALQQAIATAPASMTSSLSGLVNVAKTGVPLQRDLAAEFNDLAIDITQASRLPTSQTWYGKTLHNIASLVKFRRIDVVEGDSTDAIVSRTEKKLSANDLAGATQELKALGDEATAIAALWISKAESRVLVDQSIQKLLKVATTAAVLEKQTAN